MKSYEIREQKYKRKNIKDFKLENALDLAEILDVYAEEVAGYSSLCSDDKVKFNNFLVNFYNTWGLEARSNILPLKVFIAKEYKYVVPHKEYDDCVEEIGYRLVNVTDRANAFDVINEEYDYNKYNPADVSVEESEVYMRFEYIRVYRTGDSSKEWLHVISEKEFY